MTSMENKTIPVFGYDILRDYLLPTILGKHEKDVLYWAGKDLARKFPVWISSSSSRFSKMQAGAF